MGSRPGKGCHHARMYLKEQRTNCNLAIEGDIEKAYDNINHDILRNILEKRRTKIQFFGEWI